MLFFLMIAVYLIFAGRMYGRSNRIILTQVKYPLTPEKIPVITDWRTGFYPFPYSTERLWFHPDVRGQIFVIE
jgi:hypothetical protein